MNINDYLTVPYCDGGRDGSCGFDCWGMVRHALHNVFEGPLLNEFGSIFPRENVRMTGQFKQSVSKFEKCEPQAGALACCFYQGSDGHDVFHHVGICVNQFEVLHTSSKRGPQIMPVRAFKRIAFKVEFYRYAG